MTPEDVLRHRLVVEAGAIGVALEPAQVELFFRYLALIRRWARKARLTAVTDPAKVITLHFVDSLLCLRADVAAWDAVIDVGSGAGLPGIPMKIARPHLKMTLLEPAARKAAFLEVVAAELQLDLAVRCERAETAAQRPEFREQFAVAVARAVARTAALVELTLPFVHVGGRAVLLKGPAALQEVAESAAAIDAAGGGPAQVQRLALPTGEQRAVITIPKQKASPPDLPRRPGLPHRKPL